MEKEYRKINRGIMTGWSVISVILLIAYLLEVIKHNRTITYFTVFTVISLGPLLYAWVVYKKNESTNQIKYICSIFYGIFYTFVLLTGATPMVFTYIFPIIFLLMMTNDRRLIGIVAFGSVAVNIISVLAQIVIEKKGIAENLTEWEIQILAGAICAAYAYVSAKISQELHLERLQTVQQSEERLKQVLDKVTEVAAYVEQDAETIVEQMDGMVQASNKSVVAITDIVHGSAQSAQMVERQLDKTSSIQQMIEQTNALSAKIGECIEETGNKVDSGINNMQRLSKSAKGVESNSKLVIEHMKVLQKTTEEVESIISIINGVAGQTNLLALNASIEAARAGEAGRGFAVVAEEINGLACQTKEATQSIAKMVNTLREKAEDAVIAVEKMASLNNEQNRIIFETDEAFTQIQEGMGIVRDNVTKEMNRMEEMMTANSEIVESIHTISDVTQKVTENSSETEQITTENRETAQAMMEMARTLESRITELKQYI